MHGTESAGRTLNKRPTVTNNRLRLFPDTVRGLYNFNVPRVATGEEKRHRKTEKSNNISVINKLAQCRCHFSRHSADGRDAITQGKYEDNLQTLHTI